MLSDLLMWNKIGRIVTILSERLDISAERALDLFYSSETNKRLHDPTTLLYTFSDAYIVDDIIGEFQHKYQFQNKHPRKEVDVFLNCGNRVSNLL